MERDRERERRCVGRGTESCSSIEESGDGEGGEEGKAEKQREKDLEKGEVKAGRNLVPRWKNQ